MFGASRPGVAWSLSDRTYPHPGMDHPLNLTEAFPCVLEWVDWKDRVFSEDLKAGHNGNAWIVFSKGKMGVGAKEGCSPCLVWFLRL